MHYIFTVYTIHKQGVFSTPYKHLILLDLKNKFIIFKLLLFWHKGCIK